MGRENWPEGSWSHSQWALLRRCPRAHKLKYVHQIVRSGPASDALTIGSGAHRTLELVGAAAIANGSTDDETWTEALKSARAELDGHPAIEVTRLIHAYRTRWGDANAGYDPQYSVVGVESVLRAKTLHASLGGFAAIVDAELAHDATGRITLVEHKTAGRGFSGVVSDYIAELKSRPQYAAIAYCGRDVYGYVPTVMHNLIVKTKVPTMYRVELEFTDDELDLWEAEQEELEAMAPLSCANRDNCAPAFGFKCDYFEHCHGTSADREKLYQLRTKP
jgi:hypothetical protein